MSLTAFVLARLAEDEAVARNSLPEDYEDYPPDGWQLEDERQFERLVIPTARVLAECEAKRRIVDSLSTVDVPPSDFLRGWDTAAYFNVLNLAEVYADHPDFDESWRP